MDSDIIATYGQMLRVYGCSVDDILESPDLRIEYLELVRRSVGSLPEQQLLHRLTTLRKQSKLPRRCDRSQHSLFSNDTHAPTQESTVS